MDNADADKAWKFENTKDSALGVPSHAAISKYRELGYAAEDFYEHFPCFIGARAISRFLSIFQCYQNTLGIAGHMAEVGVFRGAVSLFLAKLALLYEPQTLTQVHGFDWFSEDQDAQIQACGYPYDEPYERVQTLVDVQGLQRHVLLHRMDVRRELHSFFEKNSHLHFKLVFLDAGSYDVTAASLREFWPRLTPGGIMVFDQFNYEVAPGETQAIRQFLPADTVIRTFPHGWMPTAFVVKS
jgi:hypothetical protein